MGEWRAARIQEVKELRIPKHRNIDRYVITRMIEDYPKTRRNSKKRKTIQTNPTRFWGFAKKAAANA